MTEYVTRAYYTGGILEHMEKAATHAAGRHCDGAGLNLIDKERDLEWGFDSEAEAAELAKKLNKMGFRTVYGRRDATPI